MERSSPYISWDQSVDEVNIYINLAQLARNVSIEPSYLSTKDSYEVLIRSKNLRVALKTGKVLLEGGLPYPVIIDESLWMIEDGVFHLELAKAQHGIVWTNVTPQTLALSATDQEEAKKQLNLARFQQEHPGFDFSQASFSGNVPDPASFMGGPRRT